MHPSQVTMKSIDRTDAAQNIGGVIDASNLQALRVRLTHNLLNPELAHRQVLDRASPSSLDHPMCSTRVRVVSQWDGSTYEKLESLPEP